MISLSKTSHPSLAFHELRLSSLLTHSLYLSPSLYQPSNCVGHRKSYCERLCVLHPCCKCGYCVGLPCVKGVPALSSFLSHHITKPFCTPFNRIEIKNDTKERWHFPSQTDTHTHRPLFAFNMSNGPQSGDFYKWKFCEPTRPGISHNTMWSAEKQSDIPK